MGGAYRAGHRCFAVVALLWRRSLTDKARAIVDNLLWSVRHPLADRWVGGDPASWVLFAAKWWRRSGLPSRPDSRSWCLWQGENGHYQACLAYTSDGLERIRAPPAAAAVARALVADPESADGAPHGRLGEVAPYDAAIPDRLV
ncbi:hypothetical protein O1L44_07325 [Streptomyces noursei]|nr:hypothetical protein [Streptomyces noursei]